MNGNVSDQKGAVMFSGAQQLHDHSTVQPTDRASTTKIVRIQRVLSVLELLGGVSIALFLAGVVVPSFVRSGMAANHDSAAGSLHALTMGGVTLWFTLQNLGFALLGGVFGVLIALAIEFPAAFAKAARHLLMFERRHLSRAGAKSWQSPSSTVSLS
ncbi:MAG TPA: hypothetical protein VHM93_13640 [Candidatus Acidoferrum sp.]|jgi:hypothetical protein|nr:hypothetical protein [Candidatus Acidoferrum sp.]